MGDNASGAVEAGTGNVAKGAASGGMAAGPLGALIGAVGGLAGTGISAIGQGRENRRQAGAAAQQAETINELIENSIMQGAEQERQALSEGGGLREELLRPPDQGRFSPNRDLTEGGRDITRGGFDPRGGGQDIGRGMDVSDRGFSVARGEYGGVRDSAGRDRLLDSARNMRQSDTSGLEAAATRTLRQNQDQLGAQLASAGTFGSGANARQSRQLQADTFTNLASQINEDQFRRQQGAAGLEAQAMADQLQREGLVLEDLFGRDQLRTQDQQARDLGMMGDRTQRDTTMFQGDLQRDLGFMQDRTQRAMGQQQDELARATSMLGDELARDQMFVQDNFNRETAALQDQMQRSGMLLDDQFRRGQLSGELMTTEGFGFYDPKRKQPTNQGK